MPTTKAWFEQLFGAPEKPDNIAGLFDITRKPDGTCILRSQANNKEFCAGRFLMPNLEELHRDYIPRFLASRRPGVSAAPTGATRVTVTHRAVADILGVHAEAATEDADTHVTFQAASQFNCLEFPSSDHTPDLGITNYIHDRTEGPACAVACAAGTVYRNYFAVLSDGYQGQTARRQINGLADAEEFLKEGAGGLSWGTYWRVRNGYIFSSVGELGALSDLLRGHADIRRAVRSKIRVGVQQGTDVLMRSREEPLACANAPAPARVTQVYCSAVSVAYSGIRAAHWATFARLVLEAAYEATLWSALVFGAGTGAGAANSGGKYKVYLTFLGGGAFGNEPDWIIESMARAVLKVRRALYPRSSRLCPKGHSVRGEDEEIPRLREDRRYQGRIHGVQLEVVVCHYRLINRDVVDKLGRLLDPSVPRFTSAP